MRRIRRWRAFKNARPIRNPKNHAHNGAPAVEFFNGIGAQPPLELMQGPYSCPTLIGRLLARSKRAAFHNAARGR